MILSAYQKQSEISGGNCSFQAIPHTAAMNTNKGEDVFLNTMIETFGKSSVVVVDDIAP